MKSSASEASVRHVIAGPDPENMLHLVKPIPARQGALSLESAEGLARPVATRVYGAWAELGKVLPAWEEILSENEGLSIFSTPEWLRSWWEAFGGARPLEILTFFDADGMLLGVVPLYEDRLERTGLYSLKRLRLVGDGSMDSDNLDLVFRPGFERACCEAFLRWLEDEGSWSVCCLNTMPENSVGARVLRQELAARKWPLLRTQSPSAAIPLPATWQEYVESLASNFRPLVTRYPRRLANRFQVRVRRWDDPKRLPEALNLLFALHQKRWTVAQEPGSFGLPQRREFYRQMAAAFLDRGWLEFWFLELDGQAIASQFCFRYRESVYLLQEGFDPDFAAEKVGYALRAALLQYFIETGVKRYDFLGGFNAHKRSWGAQPGSYQNLWLARPRSLGSCHLALDKWGTQGKEWLRQHLPSPAWRALRLVKTGMSGGCDDSFRDSRAGGDHENPRALEGAAGDE